MNDDRIFKAINVKKIPLWIWILLKFRKTYISSDISKWSNKEFKFVTHAKTLFGHTYIMKTEHYIDNVLQGSSELKRIEKSQRGLSVKFISEDELI